MNENDYQQHSPRAPVFNVPCTIFLLISAFVIVHAVRLWGLNAEAARLMLVYLSFIPAGFDASGLIGWYQAWTPVTYSLLHADWIHLGLNSLWLLVFGSLVSRRIGAVRFLIFSALAAAAGAAMYTLFHYGQLILMIGASAIVSGCMGAAARFAFIPGARFTTENCRQPTLGLVATLSNRQAIAFIVFWFIFNYVFGSGLIDMTGQGAQIAWEAHLGGFLFGFFTLPLFEKQNADTV